MTEKKKKKVTVLRLAVWFFVGVIVIGLLTDQGNPNKISPSAGSNEPTSNQTVMAKLRCEANVENMLRSPGSAKFAGHLKTTVTKKTEDTFRVKSFVDSQNSFGAMLRTNYTCTVKELGKDRWVVVDLDLQ